MASTQLSGSTCRRLLKKISVRLNREVMASFSNVPTRKSSGSTKIIKQPMTPLQILLQMGFPRHRAEKSLAATGNRGAQQAADWLLSHVYDPTLDDNSPREYILYACPTGPLLDELQNFWSKSLVQCGWNGAHNYLPHVTLVSFFKAPDESVPNMVKSLCHVVQRMRPDLPDRIDLTPHISSTFMGLFVAEEQAEVLKRLAVHFVKEISVCMITENYEPYDMISACFPWCTGTTGKFSLWGLSQFSPEAHVKDLHLTLAYQFQSQHYKTLEDLVNKIDHKAASSWEIRLYSREARISGNEVHKVIYSLAPREPDELEMVIGDFIYMNADLVKNSPDGWVEGTSWLTGCTGYFPIFYVEHTAESDAWTLHKALTVSKSDEMEELSGLSALSRRPPLCHVCSSPSRRGPKKALGDSLAEEERQVAATGSSNNVSATVEEKRTSQNGNPSEAVAEVMSPNGDVIRPVPGPRKLIVVRHAERVDLTFGTWIPYSFDEKGEYVRRDLNMPELVPSRKSGPQGYLNDTPLTRVGVLQATMTGEGMRGAGVEVHHVFASPSLRCVQTCHHILKALGLEEKIAICLEPGLFEWLGWYQSALPDFLPWKDLKEAGFNINMDYKPFVTVDDLQDRKESCEQYYLRSSYVTQGALKTTEDEGGNVLLVGHAATLDTCTRQLLGMNPRRLSELIRVIQKIPYCSLAVAQQIQKEGKEEEEEEEDGRGGEESGKLGEGSFQGEEAKKGGSCSWSLVEPPCPPVTHSNNNRFDWKILNT